MGVFRTILIVSLLVLLGFGLYALSLYRPLLEAQEAQQAYIASVTAGVPSTTVQFYPNLRFVSARIVYALAPACDETQRARVHRALSLLGRDTGLLFVEGTSEDLTITCALTPEPRDTTTTHFVAGEGGPTSILNVSSFYLIQHANVSLYRPERCDTPTVALHELLHAFGFDHTNQSTSIMYPITGCDQTIDTSILQELRRLYAIPSLPDIALITVQANITSSRFSFIAEVANFGLAPITNATLVVEGDSFTRRFGLEELEIGKRKVLSVEQIRFMSKTSSLIFRIETSDQELSKANNNVTLTFPEENV